MTKICQVVPSLHPRHGGPSRSVYQLALAQSREGHPVELLTTGAKSELPASTGNLQAHIFPRDWPRKIVRSSALDSHLRASSADVIHHHSLWLRTLHYAHRAAVRADRPLVISPRGMMSRWSWSHHRFRKQMARALIHPGALRAATGWHATSSEEAAEIRARGFTQPICVAPNGVTEPLPGQIATARDHWLEACPEIAQGPVALFYSRFHRKKRVLDLIDAWVTYGPREWLLLLVGIPEDYAVEVLEEYSLRASGPGRVKVFSGEGRPAPYAIASLFLLPSHSENFGLSIAEALAYGLPVLVTDSTPWTALNQNGAGWCVSWEDYPRALQEALAEGPAQLAVRGARARAWVLQEYAWAKPARALAQFYAELAASSPR
jgi:glycosyltransferase involved in cell wall biosynthesis